MPDIAWNKATWTRNVPHAFKSFDIENYGDHWGKVEDTPHLIDFRDRFLLPFVNPKVRALEIGSGGGRWTDYLRACQSVVCVDVNQVMLDLVRERFADDDNLTIVLTEGSNLPDVADTSIDFVFSHDVFVHVDPLEVLDYLVEIRRVIADDGTVVIHYADQNKVGAQKNDGFARNNPRLMRALIEHSGFEIVDEDSDIFKHSSVARFEPR